MKLPYFMKEISIFAPKPCILRNLRSKRERSGFSLLNLTVLSGSIPTAVYGRVVLSPLPFEFALTSLCCQNLTVDEPFVDMLWGFTFMFRCMLVKYVPKGMKVMQ